MPDSELIFLCTCSPVQAEKDLSRQRSAGMETLGNYNFLNFTELVGRLVSNFLMCKCRSEYMRCCTYILTLSSILFRVGNAQNLVKMGFIAMLVHTFIEKGHVYNHLFQNEASNGHFALACNRNLHLKALLWFIGGFFPLYLEPCAAPAFALLACSLISVFILKL